MHVLESGRVSERICAFDIAFVVVAFVVAAVLSLVHEEVEIGCFHDSDAA